MTVEYRNNLETKIQDEFSAVFKEANDYFKTAERVSILGEGIKDVLVNNTIFESYCEKLSENVDATEEEQLKILMSNARKDILQESLADISSIASLTMPVIRKLWAKIGLKYAIPTQPVKVPNFMVSFATPVIYDENDNKIELPDAIKDPTGLRHLSKRPITDKLITLTAGETINLAKESAKEPTTYKVDKINDKLDRKFAIAYVKMTDDKSKTVEGAVNVVLDINNRLYGKVKLETPDAPGTFIEDTILGSLDLDTCELEVTSMKGFVKGIKVRGHFSSENHTNATNVGFSITKRDITIGTGRHIEAALPLEFLQDTMAMYNIDGASEVIDIMSNLNAQELDIQIIEFLQNTYDGTGAKYHGEFDVHPSSQYTGNPKDWLEEVKRVIDFFALKMKSEAYFYQGYFVIVGNPLDIQILPNVSWTFNNAVDGTYNGVEVQYNIGAISGMNRYKIISSDLIPQGALTMFLVPTTDKQLTIKYYPYTFNVIRDYRNTKFTNLPSIAMTRRQTLEEFKPLICQIDIKNNDGRLPK